jgi:PEP-CTERM motif
MYKAIRLLLASMALVVLAASFAMADTVNVVTTSSGFASNDLLDWGQLGVNNFLVANGSTATSSNGITTTITFGTGGTGETLVQCSAPSCSWGGNFAPGENILSDLDSNTGGNSGDILLSFGTGIAGVGFQIEPNQAPVSVETFEAEIEVYISGVLADTFMEPGTEASHLENNSANFYGIEDLSGANITAIDVNTINCSVGNNCLGFGINQLRIADSTVTPTPEPGTLVLLGSGLLGLGLFIRRAALI